MKSLQKKKDQAFEAALSLHRSGCDSAAADAYRRILRLRPAHVGALTNLGLIHRQRGQFAEALACYQRAVLHDPRAGTAWSNLASLHLAQGRCMEAIEAGRQAVKVAPGLAAGYDNLGLALFHADRFDEAEEMLLQAVRLAPESANAWNNLGQVYQRQSRLSEAADAYGRSVSVDPGFDMAFSNLLFCMHFDSRWSREELFAKHVAWGRKFETPLVAMPPKYAKASRSKRTRPRVAFVSPDLCRHPVAVFLKPLIAHWAHDRFELGFYASVKKTDEMTRWFEGQADFWCDIFSLSDEDAADQVAADGVDVLIDLSGHTGGSRLLMFAYRPAPVQMSWLGYFDTTGMQSVNYVLADPVCVPPTLDAFFTEKILRLPDDFVCFQPPEDAPEPGPLPALGNGYVTFGSQNQLAKITEEVVALWSAVLLRVPSSRLLFQAKAFNDQRAIERYAATFERHGISLDRVDFLPGMTQAEILANYRSIDIVLDSFPCAGGTTTCEAMWMGVPVVTLLGDRFGGRHSASHLKNAGLSFMVAAEPGHYLDIATGLAADLSRLQSLRSQLRSRMLTSPLCDGARFAQNFADAIASVLQS